MISDWHLPATTPPRIEEQRGMPFLLPEPPLARGVLDRAGYEEVATFRPALDTGWWIEFRRPSFLPPRRILRDPDAPLAAVRGGAQGDVEIAIWGPGEIAEAERHVATAVSSLEIG
jgi:hypothetical protein